MSIIVQPNINVAVVSGYDEIININIEKRIGRVLFDKKKELLKANATSMDASINSSILTISQSSENVNSDGKFYPKAYVSMKGEFVGDYLDADRFEGVGEGAMAHGWGNYLLKDRKTNKVRYFDRWNERKIFYKKMMNHFVSVF